MRFTPVILVLAAGLLLVAGPAGYAADDKGAFFNGKNTDGWEGLTQYWSVKDGALIGSSMPDGLKFNTFLCSKKKYRDFELKFQVRLKEGKGNSGVQIRSKIRDSEQDKKNFAVEGPQCDIGGQYWGSLYGEHFGGMMKQAPTDAVKKILKSDDFNDYHIKCVGKHVTIKLNGETMVDDDFPKMPEEGIIAWQLHQGGPMEVTFRNIQFTELKATGATGAREGKAAARAKVSSLK